MVSMSHQYMLTDEIPDLAKWSEPRQAKKLPLLRDVDSSYYLRQEKNGLNLGPYERGCRAHWVTEGDPMPADFLVPALPGRPGAAGMVYRGRHGACADPRLGRGQQGDQRPDPLHAGRQRFDRADARGCRMPSRPACLPSASPRREVRARCWRNGWPRVRPSGTCGPATRGASGAGPIRTTRCKRRSEIYGHEYAMHFPRHAWPAGRNKRLSPIHDRIAALGAQFGAYGGWERANWFARAG